MASLKKKPEDMAYILVTDVGSTTTKARFFSNESGEWRFVVAGEAPTTVEAPYEDVTMGVQNAVREVEELTGHKILAPDGILDHLEFHPDHVALVVLILDLRLGQRGLLHYRPHHRLRPAIELPTLRELQKLTRNDRLGAEIHRRIGMIPVTDDAEPLEFLALHVEPFCGVGPALLPECDDRLGV